MSDKCEFCELPLSNKVAHPTSCLIETGRIMDHAVNDAIERCAKTIQEYADQQQSLADESEAAGGMRTPHLWAMDAGLEILEKIQKSKR